jgi:hypothetical protein
MPYLYQVGAVFMKLETTPGVDAAPTTSGSPNDYIQAIDAQFSPDFNLITRNYMRPSLSSTPHIMGRRIASLTFSTEIFGTGVAAEEDDADTQAQATPKWADLLEACAFSGVAQSTPAGKVYSPLTATQKTATFYCYYDGMLHKVTGAMGTFTINAPAGEIGTIQWTFTGVYNSPTAVATPTPAFTSVNPPLVESCSFQLGATSTSVFKVDSINFDIQNRVIQRSDANSAKGFNSMYITGRDATLSINTEQVPEASHPFWGDFENATAKIATFTIGSTAGNKMIFSTLASQISGITYNDREGIRAYDVNMRCMSTSTAGNDEVEMLFV